MPRRKIQVNLWAHWTWVNFGAWDTVPARFQHRTLYKHNPTVTLIGTAPDRLGRIIAGKTATRAAARRRSSSP